MRSLLIKKGDGEGRRQASCPERLRQAYLEARSAGVLYLYGKQLSKSVQDAACREVMAVTALSTRGVS